MGQVELIAGAGHRAYQRGMSAIKGRAKEEKGGIYVSQTLNQSIVDKLTEDGWVYMGATYWSLNKMQSMLQEGMQRAFDEVSIRVHDGDTLRHSGAHRIEVGAIESMRRAFADAFVGDVNSYPDPAANIDAVSAEFSGIGESMAKAVVEAMRWASNIGEGESSSFNPNPMQEMRFVGDTIINLVTVGVIYELRMASIKS